MVVEAKKNEYILPVIPIRDGLVFPKTESPLIFGRQKTISAFEVATQKDKQLILALQKDSRLNDPNPEDLCTTGVIIYIERYASLEHGELQVLVRGVAKVRIKEYLSADPYFVASYEEIPEIENTDDETKAMVLHLSNDLKKAINLGKNIESLLRGKTNCPHNAQRIIIERG